MNEPREGMRSAASQPAGGGASLPLAVGWTGASGIAYGIRLVATMLRAGRDVDLTYSATVDMTVPVEMDRSLPSVLEELRKISKEASAPVARGKLRIFTRDQFTAPMASGSAGCAGLVIAPCSMGTVGRLVAGTSESLLLRAADVCLKERRPLIIVPREMPLATHHLEHLARLSALGALIMPAAPGFYHRPQSIDDLLDFVVQRICDHLGVAVELTPRWGLNPDP